MSWMQNIVLADIELKKKLLANKWSNTRYYSYLE